MALTKSNVIPKMKKSAPATTILQKKKEKLTKDNTNDEEKDKSSPGKSEKTSKND